MFNFLSNLKSALFKQARLWDFNGGIHPPEMKSQTNMIPLRRPAMPEHFIVPLQQHLGPEGELLVAAGDKVLKGQPMTIGRGRVLPVHSPTSGTILSIAPHTTAHPSGLPELCIDITPDGKDTWYPLHPIDDYHSTSPLELLERIHNAGIAGLGGAGFPTASKLYGGLEKINTLIINAAECEPYITADDRLMQEYAEEILEGCRILAHILKPEQILIGIEDNKPQAIDALRQALAPHNDMVLRVIPTKYPSGGAKQLTKILTGREVPFGQHSASIGILMQNVGTAFAIKRAIINGEPLIERVVTLTGDALKKPGNVWARLGTPVAHLLREARFAPQSKPVVIMGGPLMGFTLPQLDVPIVKISNCILVPSDTELAPTEDEQSCIRCSQCVDACPAGLLPQQLHWFSKGKEHEKARQHHIFDCIECGACAYVCPSNIPLVQYYRQEKAEIWALDKEEAQAQNAKNRFEAKQARMEREKLARQERHKQATTQISTTDLDEIQAALARVQQQKQAAPTAITSLTPLDDGQNPRNEAIAAREARKALARQRKAEIGLGKDAEPETVTDPRKAALDAAIARAKAKKTAAVEATDSVKTSQPNSDDPKKAAIAAAIARVKAKKRRRKRLIMSRPLSPTAMTRKKQPLLPLLLALKLKKRRRKRLILSRPLSPTVMTRKKQPLLPLLLALKLKRRRRKRLILSRPLSPTVMTRKKQPLLPLLLTLKPKRLRRWKRRSLSI